MEENKEKELAEQAPVDLSNVKIEEKETIEDVSPLLQTDAEKLSVYSCLKKPIIVHAVQVMFPFQVNTLEGKNFQGKKGDYLMVGAQGERYICDKEIFEKTYDFVQGGKVGEDSISRSS